MKIEKKEQRKKEIMEMLNGGEDKGEAIYEAMERMVEEDHQELIEELIEENAKANADADYRRSLGLANLTQEEKDFYEAMKDVKQAITASQVDIIPTSIVDRTLDDVKKESNILKIVNFAPADVKKWVVAEHSGAAKWGDAFSTAELTAELSASINALNIEVFMLHAFLTIPKAVSELAVEFVDKYFTAILAEAMQDGLVDGYLNGDGVNAPIGIFKQIAKTESDGKHKDKTAATITTLSPKGLADTRKTLTKNGKRVVDKLYLICNPADEAEYVDPAMYGLTPAGVYGNVSFMPIEKLVDANCPQGKAAFTIDGMYTMGTTGVKVANYDQTLATKNADLVIATAYANGRAVDDDCAVVFDVTKLEEFVPTTRLLQETANA
jgi:HK97 family phage major capsid protein